MCDDWAADAVPVFGTDRVEDPRLAYTFDLADGKWQWLPTTK